MQRRFILFIAISVLILYASNYFALKNNPRPDTEPSRTVEQREDPTPSSKPEKSKTRKPSPALIGEFVREDNIKTQFVYNTIGAGVEGLSVIDYNLNKEKYQLIPMDTDPASNLVKLTIGGVEYNLDDKIWEKETKKGDIWFTTEIFEGLFIRKSVKMTEISYSGSIVVEIVNTNDDPYSLNEIKISWGPINKTEKDRFDSHKALVYEAGKKKEYKEKNNQDIKYHSIEKGWFGLKNQYFCAIFDFINDKISQIAINVSHENGIIADFIFKEDIIERKSNKKYEIPVYFGPQNYTLLKKTGYDHHKLVDFGWFHFIGVWMLYILKFFYGITKNYGVAIILLTILIRMLLWWPTQKSYTSMKKMQTEMNKMQPRLKTIKELYKNNPQKLNEETMKLYKEYQINPMGGCLPMLLQMPIFFALYSTLVGAVELKGAPFVWMWQDLSSKDPSFVLPIAMGLSMFIQQKISTPPAATPEAATQQKMMLYIMPVMLTIFAFMWPSGLLLYWVMSNLLSIGQQALINRRS